VPVDVQGSLIDVDSLSHWHSDQLQDLINDPDVSPNTVLELQSLQNWNPLEVMKEVLGHIQRSKRPVILAGTGVRISGMENEFLKLIEKLQIPVVTGWNAHDLIDYEHACNVGKPGTVGDRPGNFAVQNADLVIVLGCRLNIRQVSYNWKSFANKAFKIMIDVDQAELSKPTLSIDLPICAPLQVAIPALLELLEGYKPEAAHQIYLEWAKKRHEQYPTVLPEYSKPTGLVNPYCFIDQLFKVLNKNDVVVAGNGSACVIGFQAAKIQQGQRFFTNSGNASMGYDLPAAIGASIANDKHRVICLAGDGSLMMNLQELQTVSGYGLPVKVIVLNNEGYHSIRQTQEAYFSDNLIGIGPDTGVSLPDFVTLGGAFNIPARRLSSPQFIEQELHWFLNEVQGPALLEVMLDIDQGFSPKLSSRKLDDGTMVSPSLEDMAPFLSRDELARNTLD
jgi:acetolactate synthase-1/2/3 large subunit